MDLEKQFLFFFSAIGAFNGLLLGIYFFFYQKPKHISNYFLGALLLMLSIRIWKSVIYFFNPDLAKIYLQLGLSACFFIGPFLYLYLKSRITSQKEKHFSWLVHLLLLLILISVVGYFYTYEEHRYLWQNYIFRVIYYQWLAYIILSGFLVREILKKVIFSKEKLNNSEVWSLSLFIGNFAVWLAHYTSSYTSYIVGAISFTFVFYILLLLFLSKRKKSSLPFTEQVKYADKKIDDTEVKQLLKKLEQIMNNEKPYKNPDLNLADLAKKLNTVTHRLSQLLNDNLNKNFPLFVNEYRINEAKKLLKINDHLSLDSIAYDCGFNSKSTFYSIFKKLTGTTPAQYKNSL
jgi:AraC-like DNA-binding protein